MLSCGDGQWLLFLRDALCYYYGQWLLFSCNALISQWTRLLILTTIWWILTSEYPWYRAIADSWEMLDARSPWTGLISLVSTTPGVRGQLKYNYVVKWEGGGKRVTTLLPIWWVTPSGGGESIMTSEVINWLWFPLGIPKRTAILYCSGIKASTQNNGFN